MDRTLGGGDSQWCVQVMRPVLAVSVEDGCVKFKRGDGPGWWEFGGGQWLCWG